MTRYDRTSSAAGMLVLGLCTGAVTLVATEGHAEAAVAYVRSEAGGQPWGVNANEDAMDQVFGAGGWDDLRYETVNPAVLFSATYAFIYLEGSDANTDELYAFMMANQAALESWVSAGGGLFLNAGPNEGGTMAWGFGGVVLNYGEFPSDPGMAADAGHPIWNGPFLPTAPGGFTGSAFAHASVSGPGLVPLIVDSDGGNPHLAELSWGSGTAIFGGLTTATFWTPEAESHNLRANIIAYAASGADADMDGVGDGFDNCPEVANETQDDMDRDGMGDACDPCPADAANDADGDGACDDTDNCLGLGNPTQVDDDMDGQGNECDPCPGDADDDADGDTICGDADNCPNEVNINQADADGDGVGDQCDACPDDPGNDDDGDGICAALDNCPDAANADQADADGNGVGDACEAGGESGDSGNADESGGPDDSGGLDPDDGTAGEGSDGTGVGLTGDAPSGGSDGCGCTSGRGGAAGLPWLVVVAGAALRRRRRAG